MCRRITYIVLLAMAVIGIAWYALRLLSAGPQASSATDNVYATLNVSNPTKDIAGLSGNGKRMFDLDPRHVQVVFMDGCTAVVECRISGERSGGQVTELTLSGLPDSAEAAERTVRMMARCLLGSPARESIVEQNILEWKRARVQGTATSRYGVIAVSGKPFFSLSLHPSLLQSRKWTWQLEIMYGK